MPVVQILLRASYIRDFFSLIYPRNCCACNNLLFRHEDLVCNHCYLTLPKSNFHLEEQNEVERIFHGRADIRRAGSYYLFEKSGKVQQLLHSIKYKGKKKLACKLGNWYAASIGNEHALSKADFIIPVPLHPKKQKQRGFNQSEEFAKGLSNEWKIPLLNDILVRNTFTSTQTRKHKFERWENVQDKFELTDSEFLKNKKVIIVDDVITTGATIDACFHALKVAEGIEVSVISLAYAKKN